MLDAGFHRHAGIMVNALPKQVKSRTAGGKLGSGSESGKKHLQAGSHLSPSSSCLPKLRDQILIYFSAVPNREDTDRPSSSVYLINNPETSYFIFP
jgi:hypothetical protein